jgi:hypothetical protein
MRIGKLLSSILLVIGFLIFLPNSAIAAPLDSWHLRWTWYPPWPPNTGTGGPLTAVTYGNGIFVAVGWVFFINPLESSILTSPDGITWTYRHSGTVSVLRAVTYGNGTFVAVGDDGTIVTSPDGGTWTQRTVQATLPIGEFRAVVYGNGMFIAYGDYGATFTSPDGITWTERAFMTSVDHLGVAYGNGIFVSVGGAIFSSPDGVAWIQRYLDGNTFYGVAYVNGMFVAVGTNGAIVTSTDGVRWIKRNSGADYCFSGVAFGNGFFVVVGDTSSPVGYYGAVFTSTDGVVWTKREPGTYEDTFVSVAFGNGTFVIVGYVILQSDPIPNVFSDVPFGYWAEAYINAIYNAHITVGCSQNPLKYCPQDYVPREQMAAFIIRAKEGEPPLNYCHSGTPFTDVTADMWSCGYIKRLKELGITKGYGDGRYGPYDLVPREQMAAFLVRAVEGEPPLNYCHSGTPFTDVTADMWSCGYIKRLKELGITKGYGDGRYGPYDLVPREQMGAFLSRAFLGME